MRIFEKIYPKKTKSNKFVQKCLTFVKMSYILPWCLTFNAVLLKNYMKTL